MTTLIERVTEAMPRFGAAFAYGESRTVDGEEIVPVAFVSYGFGAGEGVGAPTADASSEQEFSGSGGGGGGMSIPVGAYLRRDGRLVFRPNPITLLCASVPVALALGFGIAAIVRAAR